MGYGLSMGGRAHILCGSLDDLFDRLAMKRTCPRCTRDHHHQRPQKERAS